MSSIPDPRGGKKMRVSTNSAAAVAQAKREGTVCGTQFEYIPVVDNDEMHITAPEMSNQSASLGLIHATTDRSSSVQSVASASTKFVVRAKPKMGTATAVVDSTNSTNTNKLVPRVRATQGDREGRPSTEGNLTNPATAPPLRMTSALEWTSEMEDMVADLSDKFMMMRV
eukprot:PhM_4_TR5200/c0_g1_i1/m.50825